MRHSAPTVILALLLLLPALPPPAAAAVPGVRGPAPPGAGPRAGETIFQEENITVLPGGRLSLNETALHFNCSFPGALGIEVRGGGELELRNCSVDDNGTYPYLLRALPGSKVGFSGCSFSRAGTSPSEPYDSGICIGTDLATIENTTFSRNAAGLCFQGVQSKVVFCQFLENGVGALLDGSNVSFDRCRFYSTRGGDASLVNASQVRVLDTQMNISAVAAGPGSRLDRLWSLSIGVQWSDRSPAAGALVSVGPSDAPASLYQADENGRVTGILVNATTVDFGGAKHHGPFNISATARDRTAWNMTDMTDTTEVLLTLDSEPPLLTIEYPEEGAFLSSSGLTARGRAWDQAGLNDLPGIDRVEARLDGGDWAPAQGTGEWSFQLANLTEGIHTLDARAWDLALNQKSGSVVFEVDLTAPVLELWPPPGYLTAAPNVTVKIISDGTVVLFNGTEVSGFRPGVPCDLDWPLAFEGGNCATVSSRDAAGNSISAGLLVIRDTVGPRITILDPPDRAVLNTTFAVVSGSCSDPNGIALVEVSLDEENWTRCSGEAGWSAPVVLAEGQNTVTIRARDIAGNSNLGLLQLTVRLPDTAPPVILVLYPADGSAVSSSRTEFSGKAEDPGGVTLVQLMVGNGTWVNASGTGSWLARLELASGNNTITVRAVDAAGNANLSIIHVRYVPAPPDTTPPSITVLYPPHGLKVTGRKLVVSGKATDPSGVSIVECSLDGRNWTRCILTGEDWSATVTLSPGTNKILVRARDGSGNLATNRVAVSLEAPGDPAQERQTYVLMLILGLLAVLAVALLQRGGRGRAIGQAPEEE